MRNLFASFMTMLLGVSMAFSQVTTPLTVQRSTPTITIAAATADSTDFPTTGAHQLTVEFSMGVVTGSYTTCTMQAKTEFNSTFYTIGSAASVTITSNTKITWVVAAPLASTVSTSAANDFGGRTKLTFACSGAYGTTIASPALVVYASPNGAAGTVSGHVIVDTAPSTAVTNAGTFAEQITPTANNTLGVTECILVSTATTNATNCKASAGMVYGFQFVNTTATLYYLRLYNTASAPTCSSATGFIRSIPIPASTSGGQLTAPFVYGVGYGTGISFCFTGGSSSTDNTNAAIGVYGVIWYD